MANDLKNMSKKQLEKLLKDVQKALNSIQGKERREAKKAAEKVAAKFGFSLSELTETSTAKPAKRAPGPKTKAQMKFANPGNPNQKWTGKGRQPQWFKDAVAAGTDVKSMEI